MTANKRSSLIDIRLAVAVSIAAAAASGCSKKAAGKWTLPVDPKQLPGQTSEVEAEVIDGTRETDAHLRTVFTSSELGAEICKPGAGDPATQLQLLTLLGPQAAKQFFSQHNIDTVHDLMECGELLTSNLDGNFQTGLLFKDDSNAKQEVGVLNLKTTEIPAKYGFTKHSFSGLDGFCKPLGADCGPSSEAALHQGNTWFLGKRSALETLAHNVASPKTDLSTAVSAINDAATETEGLSSARIQGEVESSKAFLQAPCAWGAFQSAGAISDFMQACFPSSDDHVIQSIDGKLRAAAFELEPDVQKAGAVHGNIVFVARDSDGAKDVEKDAGELVTDWKSQLSNNESKLIKQAKTDPITQRQKSWAVIVDNWAHALEKMKVNRSGRTVTIAFNEPLGDDDRRDLDDASKKTLDTRSAVADVLDAIGSKQNVPVPALTKLVGQPWAQYLAGLSHPSTSSGTTGAEPTVVELTSTECKVSKKSAAKIKPSELPTPQAVALLAVLKGADCAHPPKVTPGARSCLQQGFKTPADFAKCAAPGASAPSSSGPEPPEGQFGVKK